MKIIHNKLVRDCIPEIVTHQGKQPVTEILDDARYKSELNKKLLEEVREYLESGEPEEICDILEILYAILDFKGISKEEAEIIRLQKAEKNGAFKDKIYLKEVIKQD